ncbi:MAG: hypothetical protein ABL984_02565 [Pyrinomonadaceae bacterium]
MIVPVFNGTVEFRRSIAAPAVGGIPGGADAAPPLVTTPVINDTTIRAGYVSLASPKVRIAAAEFKVTQLGNMRRVGWVNIILESTRKYLYHNGMIVSETVNNLPTWDGSPGEQAPYYFGQWCGVGANGDGNLMNLGLNQVEDLPFNDDPCMPPSYNLYEHAGIPLGKILISKQGADDALLTGIDGRDRYLACLMVTDNAMTNAVVWSVSWEVVYKATITRPWALGPVTVALDPTSQTRVNTGGAHNADNLIAAAISKSSSVALKQYTLHKAPTQLDHQLNALRRSKSSGNLRGPF